MFAELSQFRGHRSAWLLLVVSGTERRMLLQRAMSMLRRTRSRPSSHPEVVFTHGLNAWTRTQRLRPCPCPCPSAMQAYKLDNVGKPCCKSPRSRPWIPHVRNVTRCPFVSFVCGGNGSRKKANYWGMPESPSQKEALTLKSSFDSQQFPRFLHCPF